MWVTDSTSKDDKKTYLLNITNIEIHIQALQKRSKAAGDVLQTSALTGVSLSTVYSTYTHTGFNVTVKSFRTKGGDKHEDMKGDNKLSVS